MNAYIRRPAETGPEMEMIEDVWIVKLGKFYPGAREYVELWKDSVNPYKTVFVDEDTQVILGK